MFTCAEHLLCNIRDSSLLMFEGKRLRSRAGQVLLARTSVGRLPAALPGRRTRTELAQRDFLSWAVHSEIRRPASRHHLGARRECGLSGCAPHAPSSSERGGLPQRSSLVPPDSLGHGFRQNSAHGSSVPALAWSSERSPGLQALPEGKGQRWRQGRARGTGVHLG